MRTLTETIELTVIVPFGRCRAETTEAQMINFERRGVCVIQKWFLLKSRYINGKCAICGKKKTHIHTYVDLRTCAHEIF